MASVNIGFLTRHIVLLLSRLKIDNIQIVHSLDNTYHKT